MLSEYLKGNIQFLEKVENWEKAIRIAAEPLLNKENINQKYIQDMIDNININGPYVVIVPGIALPHAKNGGGVIKTGISLLKLREPVLFPETKEVNILIVLAAEDSDGHLDLISDLSSILIDEDVLIAFRNTFEEEKIINLIKSVE